MILLTLLFLLIATPAAAHDWTHRDFARNTIQQREWLQKQRRPFTKLSCCNEADGEQVDEEIRYDDKGIGRYWIQSKHTRGQWMLVPEEAIIREPNMHGRPVAWFRWVSHDGSFAAVPRPDMTPTIFCYAPGPLL